MLQYVSATPQPFNLLVSLESGGLGGHEHLDHSNHSGLVSSENCHRAQTASRVDLRLGTPGNNLCETWFEIPREKMPRKFREPFFTSRTFLAI